MNSKQYSQRVLPFFDAAAVCLSYYLAFLLRFDFSIPAYEMGNFLRTLPLVLVIRLLIYWRCQLYASVYRYAGLADFINIIKAVLASQVLVTAVVLLKYHGVQFPRSVFFIDPVIALILAALPRFARRLRAEVDMPFISSPGDGKKLLIFGAGDMGESVVRNLKRMGGYDVQGFIDDDANKWGRSIHGVTILGGRDRFLETVDKKRIEEVLIAVHYSRGQILQDLMKMLSGGPHAKVALKAVPALSEHLKKAVPGGASGPMRNIETSDLLNRKPVHINSQAISDIIKGKTVLVTGAGGTIGSELCRQVAEMGPSLLLLLENNNTSLFYIDRELSEMAPRPNFIPIAGDIQDERLVENLLVKYKPQVIFHAAAHKHVPLMEANPQEAVKNNTLGTYYLARMAKEHGVERFLYISTDKAVRPSSIMGASKRMGEMVIRGFAKDSKTRFMSVRFGNVLGSSGSVVKIFEEQIARGGPVTVTHRDITRFFMTVEEAVQLVLQACTIGQGGEIFVLNMGEPVKLSDLARSMIMLHGLVPDKDIKIEYVGLRPGEKMYEELFCEKDIVKDTGHPDIFMAVPEEASAVIMHGQIPELIKVSQDLAPEPVLAKIKQLVPAYKKPNICPPEAESKR
ncbi:MAG: polysaccharide biosynthesis protein [Elusimicrobia bacterium]|nr:polysaccharide biosynthesis protein [Elusimicrobiota bacterium]